VHVWLSPWGWPRQEAGAVADIVALNNLSTYCDYTNRVAAELGFRTGGARQHAVSNTRL
jgi:hypothetical protein